MGKHVEEFVARTGDVMNSLLKAPFVADVGKAAHDADNRVTCIQNRFCMNDDTSYLAIA